MMLQRSFFLLVVVVFDVSVSRRVVSLSCRRVDHRFNSSTTTPGNGVSSAHTFHNQSIHDHSKFIIALVTDSVSGWDGNDSVRSSFRPSVSVFSFRTSSP
jgi:hypothetical protein